jgi:hypothetical protein
MADFHSSLLDVGAQSPADDVTHLEKQLSDVLSQLSNCDSAAQINHISQVLSVLLDHYSDAHWLLRHQLSQWARLNGQDRTWIATRLQNSLNQPTPTKLLVQRPMMETPEQQRLRTQRAHQQVRQRAQQQVQRHAERQQQQQQQQQQQHVQVRPTQSRTTQARTSRTTQAWTSRTTQARTPATTSTSATGTGQTDQTDPLVRSTTATRRSATRGNTHSNSRPSRGSNSRPPLSYRDSRAGVPKLAWGRYSR